MWRKFLNGQWGDMFHGLTSLFSVGRYMAMLGVLAVTVSALPHRTIAMEPKRLALSDQWKPTDAVYWLSNAELLVIAAKRAETGGVFKLMRVNVDGSETDISPLSGEAHCWESDGRLLVRVGEDEIVHGWTASDGLTEPLKDQRALRRCNAWRPDAIEEFEAQIGPMDSIERNGDLFAGAVVGGAAETALVLFTQTEELGRWPVAWDLARDIALIEPLHDGGFLVYPSVRAELRAELAEIKPELPVWRIGSDASIDEYQMPWDDWNEVGLYRLAITAKGLVAAQLRGVRENSPLSGLYTEASGWKQTHAADLTPESLTVSPDGCQLAWLERGMDEDDKLAEIMISEVCTK